MNKLKLIVFILGCSTFFIDTSWGLGWVLGSLVMFLLNTFREPILDRIIDFKNIKISYYILYLLAVMLLIALPLLLAFWIPDIINPLWVFVAYFTSRILDFITRSRVKKGG